MLIERRARLFLARAALLAPHVTAQEGTLDLADGETLYRGGWLLTS